jgi:hypothetical protein
MLVLLLFPLFLLISNKSHHQIYSLNLLLDIFDSFIQKDLGTIILLLQIIKLILTAYLNFIKYFAIINTLINLIMLILQKQLDFKRNVIVLTKL